MADCNEDVIGRNSNINLNNREANRNEERGGIFMIFIKK